MNRIGQAVFGALLCLPLVGVVGWIVWYVATHEATRTMAKVLAYHVGVMVVLPAVAVLGWVIGVDLIAEAIARARGPDNGGGK